MTIDTIIYEDINNQKRIALLGNGELKELEITDSNKALESNIYYGKITHKVDLANGKTGFLVDINDSCDAFLNAEEPGVDLGELTEGQSLIVQVSQEKRAEKGAKVVRSLQFVGKNIVYRPFFMNVEASYKIENKAKLAEYKNLVNEHMTGQEGWLLRTNSIYAEPDELIQEMKDLRAEYDSLRAKARKAKAPALLYEKSNPLLDYIDRYAASLNKVVVNSKNAEKEIVDNFEIDFEIEVKKEPFKEYLLEDAILEALQKEVKLKNGGKVIIEETRACVAIDVDSSSDCSNGPISRLNAEAAVEIAKQIRLRNLAGKIIIDFAGSTEYRYIKPVIEVLEKELKKDCVRATCLGLSKAGNVEILRIRRRPSLKYTLTKDCDTCQGTGVVEK